MKIIPITITFVLLLVFVVPGVLSFGIKAMPASDQPPLKTTQKVTTSVMSQPVISQNNNFSGVGVSIKNPNLQNKEDLVLEVIEQNGNGGLSLQRSSSVNGSHIPDGGYVKFFFEPITDSKNKVYILSFKADKAAPDKALEVYLTSQPQVSLATNSDYPIAAVMYYQPDSRLSLPLNIYSHWWSKFSQDFSFALFYGGILIGSLVYLVLFAIKKSKT